MFKPHNSKNPNTYRHNSSKGYLKKKRPFSKKNVNFYKEPKLIGFDNNDETHFMNSNLQCLSQTKPLTSNISSNENFIENKYDFSKNIQKKGNQIKNKSNFNKETQENKNEKNNIKNKDENLKIDAHIEMINKIEENNIDKIYELSNNRIAVIKRKYYFEEEELKIYSLNNYKLLYEIKLKERSKNIVELKNKDLIRAISSSLEFYKLDGQKYKLFQKIEEEKININSILGLMNGNLISFNTYGIEIYSKEKEKDKYKSISKIKMEDRAMNGYEIEQNKLIIFKKIPIPKKSELDSLDLSNEDNSQYPRYFVISFFDLVNDEEKILVKKKWEDNIEYEYDYEIFNFLKNDKYLFVNFQITESYNEHWVPNPCYKYGCHNRELDFWEKKYLNVGYIFNISNEKYLECDFEIPPEENRIAILCNYNNDLFIAKKGSIEKKDDNNYYREEEEPPKDENQLNIIKYEDKTFKSYRQLSFDDDENIMKLRNNNFIIYSSKEIKLFKIY